MEEQTAAAFHQEGTPLFDESNAEETASDSQSESENQDGNTGSAHREDNNGTKDTPFHEHPRWKQREDEWNNRFNDQERRHQEDLKTIREEFGSQRRENAQQTKPPAWFGGTQEQWDAYRADRDSELKSAEDRAEKRVLERIQSEQSAGNKAVEEATTFMNSEVAAIEADTTLNPSGSPIDKEKLLKTVLDNELIDAKGRWNYRAGWKLMNAGSSQGQQREQQNNSATEKKKVAAATTSEGRGDDKKPTYATSDTFKRDRPW